MRPIPLDSSPLGPAGRPSGYARAYRPVHRASAGVTLIELSVVVVIAGILASVTVYSGRPGSNKAQCKAFANALTNEILRIHYKAISDAKDHIIWCDDTRCRSYQCNSSTSPNCDTASTATPNFDTSYAYGSNETFLSEIKIRNVEETRVFDVVPSTSTAITACSSASNAMCLTSAESGLSAPAVSAGAPRGFVIKSTGQVYTTSNTGPTTHVVLIRDLTAVGVNGDRSKDEGRAFRIDVMGNSGNIKMTTTWD